MENWTDDTRFIPTAQGLASANRAKPGTLPEVPGLVLMGPTQPRLKALGDMLEERRKQERLWGPHHDAQHNAVEWCAIAQDYLGRASRLAIDAGDPDELRRRWLQVAAVLLAAVEEHDLRAVHATGEAVTGATIEPPPVEDGARATTCPSCSGRATLEVLQVETPAGRIRRYVVRCWNHDQRPGQRCDWTVTDRPLADSEPPTFPGPPARTVEPPAPIMTLTAACTNIRRCPLCSRRIPADKPKQKHCSRQCSLDANRLTRAQRKARC